MILTNSTLSSVFTIQDKTWGVINARVGIILYLNKLANTSGGYFMIPWPDDNTYNLLENLSSMDGAYNTNNLLIGIRANNPGNIPAPDGQVYTMSEWVIDTNLPTVLPQSIAWSTTTYFSLISLAQNLQIYANTYAENFKEILQQYNQVQGSTVPPQLQSQTSTYINNLKKDTAVFITQSNNIFTDLQNFLSAHQAFEAFLNRNSFLLPLMNIPELDPDAFSNFQTAIQTVIGTWTAIQSSLEATECTPAIVDLTFLETLNLQVAINQWGIIANETGYFISFANGQSQLWQFSQ